MIKHKYLIIYYISFVNIYKYSHNLSILSNIFLYKNIYGIKYYIGMTFHKNLEIF